MYQLTPDGCCLHRLQEFSAAIASITAALTGVSMSDSGSPNNSLSGSGVRPSASGRKQVLPTGVSTLNPDSFYHTKVGVHCLQCLLQGGTISLSPNWKLLYKPNNSLSGSGVRPSASGRKQVLPTGVSTPNPDSFYHTKVGSLFALAFSLLSDLPGSSV
jgi:hypothetical protein